MQLLIGCGTKREKRIALGAKQHWDGLVTLDMNADHKPDVVHDLSVLPLPFAENSCDEIHAYDVLEHMGAQGDWRFFFAQWMDFYRLLKPGGVFFGICPSAQSRWAWGDPGHTRIIGPECLVFLQQPQYQKQIGFTPMTDYRFVFSGDFEPEYVMDDEESFKFALRAIKPART